MFYLRICTEFPSECLVIQCMINQAGSGEFSLYYCVAYDQLLAMFPGDDSPAVLVYRVFNIEFL